MPESWRIITPILLCVLTGLSAQNLWLLTDIKTEIRQNTKRIERHIEGHIFSQKETGKYKNVRNNTDSRR